MGRTEEAMKAAEIKNRVWRKIAQKCRYRIWDETRNSLYPGHAMCRNQGAFGIARCMQRVCPLEVKGDEG